MRKAWWLLIVMVVSSLAYAAPPDVTGLWGNETVFGPTLSGTLTVDGRQPDWRATIGGVSADVDHADGTVNVAMPGGLGRFRGRLSHGLIEGFWIQPASPTLGSPYATPLTLTASAPHVWRGRVDPLPDRVSQYLRITRAADGTLHAFLRNPEYNLGRGRRYDVKQDGDAVVLTDPGRKGWALHGRLDEETGQLRIDWQGVGVFAFTRRDRDHAIGYYASTPAMAATVMPVPVPDGDGWMVATPASVGLRTAPLEQMLRHIAASDTPTSGDPQIHAVLIARHGKLVFERYFHGYVREGAHDTRSAGKSFASLLVGLAIAHGARITPQTPVLSMFPRYTDLAHLDARKRAITVADLMDMTSGLACDDDNSDSPGNEDVMQSQHTQSDWYRYTLDLPMARAPGGTKAVYCSAGINLLGGVLRQATGRRLTTLFRDWIAEPMQMRGYHINLMPHGDAYLAGGIHLRARDLLKLGQLYLDGGTWHGRQLVDRKWIAASVSRHANFGPNHDYGYAWHLHTFTTNSRVYREYAAEGNGGQFVMVVPELDLAVVVMAGNYGRFDVWYPFQTLVTDYIIPATGRAAAQ